MTQLTGCLLMETKCEMEMKKRRRSNQHKGSEKKGTKLIKKSSTFDAFLRFLLAIPNGFTCLSLVLETMLLSIHSSEPSVFLFWMGTLAFYSTKAHTSTNEIYIECVVVCVFSFALFFFSKTQKKKGDEQMFVG